MSTERRWQVFLTLRARFAMRLLLPHLSLIWYSGIERLSGNYSMGDLSYKTHLIGFG